MTSRRIHGLAFAAGALALAASSAPASAYLQFELQDTMISSYSIGSAATDDLPASPLTAPPTPRPDKALPKMLETFQKGKVKNCASCGRPAPRLSAAPRR